MREASTATPASNETGMPTAGQVGALIVGGEHPGLGVARSLGRRGIPVCVVDDQQSISRFSK
jgi:D-aspartate ligase